MRCQSCVASLVVITFALSSHAVGEGQAGLIVEEVAKGSAAEKLGIKIDDELLSFAGRPLTSVAALQAAEQNTFGKKEAALRLQRDGKTLTLIAPLGELGIQARPELPTAALILYEEGLSALNEKKTGEAIAKWTLAAERAQEEDSTAAAWLYRKVGMAYQEQGQWKKAYTFHEKEWGLLKDSKDTAAQSRSLSSLGWCSENLDDLQSVRRWYEQALRVNTTAGYQMWAADNLYHLGVRSKTLGNLTASHDYHTRALAIRERLSPNSLEVAASLTSLGKIARDRDELGAAHDYFSRALTIEKRLAYNPLDIADTLTRLGGVAATSGKLAAADDHLRSALEIYERRAPNSREYAVVLGNLGNVAFDRGDLDAAREYFNGALDVYERPGQDPLDAAGVLTSLGTVACKRRNFDAARDYYTRALKIRERLARNTMAEAQSLSNLGVVAWYGGDLKGAYEYYNSALEICERRAPNTLRHAGILGNLALVARDRNDLPATGRYLRRTLDVQQRLAPDSLVVAKTLNNLGRLSLDERRFSDALDYFSRAVAIVEAHGRKILSPEARALFVDQQTNKYAGLIRSYLEMENLPAAFDMVERSRARSLVELLTLRGISFRADGPEDLTKKQKALDQKRLTAYSQLTELDPKKNAKRIAKLRADLLRYAIQQRELEERIRQASPKYAALEYPAPLNLKEAQSTLDAGTVLLAYYVDALETYMFALRARKGKRREANGEEDLQVFRVKMTALELKRRVDAFRAAVIGKKEVKQLGKELYDLLVRPAHILVEDADRVLISPDFVLDDLPFAALVVEEDEGGVVRYFADFRPLHTIVSMGVYAEIRHSPPATKSHAEGAVVAFGDPDYDGMKLQGQNLDRIPGTGRQVESIIKLYGNKVKAFLGEDATETAAKENIGSARLIHFACHGLLDNDDPLGSGLALRKTEEDDGLLQAYEIFGQIRLDADLVVLSACDTGLGETTKNEGIIGLTRALQYAGARSIVASLWNVSDDSTAALMEAFYRELKHGASKDVALQRAMAAVRDNPMRGQKDRPLGFGDPGVVVRRDHPYYWAAFTLIGDWR